MVDKHFEMNESASPIIADIGEHIPGGFFMYHATSPGTLIYANRAVFDMFGCANDDEFRRLTGFTFKGMVHPDDYVSIEKSITDQVGSNDRGTDHVEYRIIRKDGSIRWVDDYGRYVETDLYGGIYYVFISDITESHAQRQTDMATRQAVIEALSESYHTMWLVEDVETGTFVLYRGDPEDDTFREAPIRNERGQLQYSKAKEFYIRTTVAPADQNRLADELELEKIAQRLQDKPQFTMNYLRVMDDGSKRYFSIEFAKVNMPNGKMGIVCGFKDIDEEVRKAHEQNQALSIALAAAEQANQAKTAFLSNMSHEIRTPMNAIIGRNNLALNDPATPASTREHLEKIDAAAHHLLDIINDILDMSRIESGNMVLDHEEFSLDAALDHVNSLIEAQCREAGLVYDPRVIGAIDERFIGDDRKLFQILINILDNAVKFTPAGGFITFTTEEVTRLDDKATLRFVIKDTGIGMSEEYLPHIFETFSQEDASTTTKYSSTGLGLPITKQLVEMMNGHIEVESEKGTGTTFTVTVTLETVSTETKPTGDTTPERTVSLEGRRVLLAEDMTVNAEIILMVLGMRQINADIAENGRVALEMFEASPEGYYDAILMDMRMPEMDGLEATRAIRNLERPDAATIPIIALTANALDEDVQRSMQAGLNEHLSKPVEPDVLFETLERFIDQR